jgi:hypothetical protein
MSTAKTPKELFQLAQLGHKLKPSERLAVVTWLEGSGEIEQYGPAQLAQVFGCKPAAIKKLTRKARQAFAAAITEEDAMAYMVNFLRSTDVLIKECKKMLADANIPGTQLHLGYMRLLMEVETEKIEKLQSIGVIPKELGRLTSVKEEWIAEVSDEGVTSVREAGDE